MNFFKRILFPAILLACMFAMPVPALADWDIVDSLNLAPFVPMVLDSIMMVATGGYEFFVEGTDGNGIIYMLIWGFFIVSLTLGIIKMFFPKTWVSFFGFSGGGDFADGKVDATNLVQNNLLKPAMRAIIAAAILLQIKPIFVTEWLVNPFLQFGAIYTEALTDSLNRPGAAAPKIECPPDIIAKGWISKSSCEFMTQPVSILSHANNQVIKQGFDFLLRGLRGLLTLIPHGGEDFMNVVTGLVLITTFVSSNLFMALLVIQAIFFLGMSLILYPFQVLSYVAKPSDKWLDIWPAFSGITSALQRLVITMIACAFILCINVAVIHALFRWNSSVFVVSAGGTAVTNVPQIANTASGFGQHSLTWLSAILTLYLMFRIFKLTQEQLDAYVGGKGMDGLYKNVTSDAKKLATNVKNIGTSIGKAAGWIKKK